SWRPMKLLGLGLLTALRTPGAVSLQHVPQTGNDFLRSSSMLQLSSMEMRSHTMRRLSRRWKHAHPAWSEPCRQLPLAERPSCERQVDRDLLNEKGWVQTEPRPARLRGARAASIKLKHD
ncbi:Hypothetical protein SCF082_LOCUS31507, partial [Durusdinium trenchii]